MSIISENNLFCSIKVAGVSGSGKTTIIKAVTEQTSEIKHLCFSDYLKKYGHLAEQNMRISLCESRGLVLMDEHLEIGVDNLSLIYKEEKTVGIFVIDASCQEILERRKKDCVRIRCGNLEQIIIDQIRIRERAISLSIENNIPVLFVKSGSIAENVELLNSFIKLIWRR